MYGMVNGNMKESLQKKFYTRTTLAKKLGKPVSTIERMLFRQVIIPDAWVVEISQSHPLFDASRLEEIKTAMEEYFSQLEASRVEFYA
jgi:hypothetical protein